MFFWKMNVLKVELLSKGIFVTRVWKIMGGEGVTDLWRNIWGEGRYSCDMGVTRGREGGDFAWKYRDIICGWPLDNNPLKCKMKTVMEIYVQVILHI